MTLATSLTISPQILQAAFQSAFLVSTGRGTELSGALSDQFVQISDLQSLTQVETLVQGAAVQPVLLPSLIRSLAYLKERGAADYRSPACRIPDRTVLIGGHEMVGIPGGWYIRGHSRYGPADGWVRVPPYFIGRELVSRRSFLEIVGRHPEVGEPRAPGWDPLDDEPVVNVSFEHAVRFAEALCADSRQDFRLPTREEWEIAARGPAICLNRLMEEEEGRFRPGDLPEFAQGRFQNFFFELGGEIFSDPRDKSLEALLRKGRDLYAYRVFATNSGREPPKREPPPAGPSPSGKTGKVLRIWPILSSQVVEMEVPLTISPLGFIAEGEKNVWGLKNLTRGLWQVLGGGWAVGGSYLSQNTNYFWATAVISSMAGVGSETGLRLALPIR